MRKTRAVLGLLLCAAALLAPAPGAAAQARIAFGEPVIALDPCDNTDRSLGVSRGAVCYEPTIAVDSRNRVFATDGFGEAIGVSTDGGREYRRRAAPPPPTGDVVLLGDAIVQIDPRGRLVFSNIYATGIQVAISSDGARTWESNVVVGAGPVSAAPAPDRQWIAFGPRGLTYVFWHTPATPAVWAATSQDGGRTFAPPQPIVPGAEVFDMGQPSVDKAGRVFVPLIIGDPVLGGTAVAVAVSASGAGAASFVLHQVASESANFFPAVAVSRSGHVAAAWRGGDGAGYALHVSDSVDHGRTWSRPRRWSGNAAIESSPWIGFRDDHDVDVLWFRAGELALVDARGPARGRPSQQAIVAVVHAVPGRRSPSNTDYAHYARLRDGRIVAVWSDESAVFAAVEAKPR